jgi:DNA-binding MarR family transcriptional regulator
VEHLAEGIFVLAQRCHKQLLKLIHAEMPDSGFPALGINFKQGVILKILQNEDGITQRELTQRLKITSSSCGELIVKLEQRGYLKRRANASDKRTSDVYLTKQGRTIAGQYREQSRVLLEEWSDSLTAQEKEQLYGLLTKLSDGLQMQIEGKGE